MITDYFRCRIFSRYFFINLSIDISSCYTSRSSEDSYWNSFKKIHRWVFEEILVWIFQEFQFVHSISSRVQPRLLPVRKLIKRLLEEIYRELFLDFFDEFSALQRFYRVFSSISAATEFLSRITNAVLPAILEQLIQSWIYFLFVFNSP